MRWYIAAAKAETGLGETTDGARNTVSLQFDDDPVGMRVQRRCLAVTVDLLEYADALILESELVNMRGDACGVERCRHQEEQRFLSH
jgi:hypothetical protein